MERLHSGNSKAVITADLHLKTKPGLWSGRSEICGDDEYGLQQVVDVAADHGADLYILGDALDKVSNLPRPSVLLQRHLSRVLAGDSTVRYIQGNHDMVAQDDYATEPWLSVVHGEHGVRPQHIDGCLFDFCGMAGYALDFFPAAYAEETLASVPSEAQVLMLHGSVSLCMPNYQFTPELIPEHIQYVFAGDWHPYSMFKPRDGLRIMYPGDTYMWRTSEDQDKYCLLVEQTDDGIDVTPIKLNRRPVFYVSDFLTENEQVDTDELTAAINNADLPADAPEELHTPVMLLDAAVSAEKLAVLRQSVYLYSLAQSSDDSLTALQTPQEDDQSDAEVLEQFMPREQDAMVFDFTLDVIQNGVTNALERLKEKLEVSEEDILAMMKPTGDDDMVVM
jgi:DNA repair exonuclease SbcCD nuclease subunit